MPTNYQFAKQYLTLIKRLDNNRLRLVSTYTFSVLPHIFIFSIDAIISICGNLQLTLWDYLFVLKIRQLDNNRFLFIFFFTLSKSCCRYYNYKTSLKCRIWKNLMDRNIRCGQEVLFCMWSIRLIDNIVYVKCFLEHHVEWKASVVTVQDSRNWNVTNFWVFVWNQCFSHLKSSVTAWCYPFQPPDTVIKNVSASQLMH